MPANISINDLLSNADPQKISQAYENLKDIERFDDLLVSPPIDDATELAKNQIMHMVESWRYLASSVNAFLRNADGNAIHLAYYAELRAVISLYAGSGILINNSKNGYIDTNGTLQNFKGLIDNSGSVIAAPTHKITWGLWKEWSKGAYALNVLNQELILYKTSPQNLNMHVISQKIGSMATSNIIQSWGVDLLHLADDHVARNVHSYQPYWTDNSLTIRDQEDIKFVKEVWKLLLPQGYNAQGMHFDVALVEYILQRLQADRNNNSENGNIGNVKDELAEYILQQLGISQDIFYGIFSQESYDLNLFELASNVDSKVKNVLSRAVFLSRIAKLAVEQNINAHSSGKAWILYWLQHCGIWDPSIVDDPYDLKDDYEAAVDDFNPSNPNFDIWHTAGNICPAAFLSKPEACLSWNFSS